MKDALARHWAERTPRERWILIGGAVVLALAILYAYVWLPVARERERLLNALPALRAQANEMRAAALEIQRLRAAPAAASPITDLKAMLAGLATQRRAIRTAPQMSTEANGRVRVAFASITEKEWQGWIAAAAERGVRIEAVQMEALEVPGVIKASAILSSAP